MSRIRYERQCVKVRQKGLQEYCYIMVDKRGRISAYYIMQMRGTWLLEHSRGLQPMRDQLSADWTIKRAG